MLRSNPSAYGFRVAIGMESESKRVEGEVKEHRSISMATIGLTAKIVTDCGGDPMRTRGKGVGTGAVDGVATGA